MSEHTNMITCSAGGDAASAMARTAVLEVAEGPSRDGNDQLGPQLRRVRLQMRNAQRRRCLPVPNSGGFSIRIESQKQTQEAESRGYLLSKRRSKASLDLLVQPRWRWMAHVTACFRLCLAAPTRRYASLLP